MTNVVQLRPNVLTGVAPVPTYATGVADGDECRRCGGSISTLRLVAINDEYSAGFRAGFFQRD